MGQDNPKLQPGDLIEVDRPRHQHWALYLGNGYVINLIPVGKQDLKVGVHTVPLFIRKVKKQLLKEVVQNHKWRVNNKYDHSYKPLQKKEIIWRAERYNDRKLNYCGFGSNCEHFVTNLRYGGPAKTALQNINSISSVVMAGIGVSSLIAAAAIPVVGLPIVASASFAVAGGGSLLASIGFTSSNIAHSLTFDKFEKAGRHILENSCC